MVDLVHAVDALESCLTVFHQRVAIGMPAQFERTMMERRSELDEQRVAIEEEFQQKREQLSNSGGDQNPNAWQELDQEQQQRFEALDEQYQALDRESQEYWNDRQDDGE
jgi:hypothetical protein